MCEIFLIKHNKEEIKFSKEAIGEAIFQNSDGCGYVIFQKIKKGKFKLIEIERFNYLEDIKPKIVTPKTVIEKPANKIIVPTIKERVVGFELIKNNKIILTTISGAEQVWTLPLDLYGIEEVFEKDKWKAVYFVYEWLTEKGIDADFWNSVKDQEECLAKGDKEDGIAYSSGVTEKEVKELEKEWETLSKSVPTQKEESIKATISRLYEKQLDLEEDQVMLMHFRNATIGYGEKNTQPIVRGNFLVIHNGVFSKMGNYLNSDTTEFTIHLDQEYDKAKVKTKFEEKKVVDRVVKEVTGWYSMFIYSWKTGRIYYYKDGASFHEINNGLLMSTREARFPSIVGEMSSRVLQ